MEIDKYKFPNYFTWTPLDIKQPKHTDIEKISISHYLDKILNSIEITDKIVGFQIPEGLKPVIIKLISQIANIKPDLKIITFFEPCFGSCDVVESNHSFIDKIFHFGNSGMPDIKTDKTVFIEMFYNDINLDVNNIVKEAKLIGNKIGLLYNIQFLNQINKLEKALMGSGSKPIRGDGSERIKYAGQILGCNYTSLTNVENLVDGFIVLTHGDFHSQMIPVLTTKRVLVVDVINSKLNWLNDTEDRIVFQRIQLIEECTRAVDFGLIVSSKAGQNRINEAYKMQEELARNGKMGYVLMGNNSYSHYFHNFNVDAFINFACPRIAINNYEKFHKPILTVTEAYCLLNNLKYEFDTIQ